MDYIYLDFKVFDKMSHIRLLGKLERQSVVKCKLLKCMEDFLHQCSFFHDLRHGNTTNLAGILH